MPLRPDVLHHLDSSGRLSDGPDPLITPLMQAAYSPQVPLGTLLALMVQHDPLDLDRRGRSALMLAAWQGGVEKVRALIPVSDVHHVDEQGVNALMIAAGVGDPDRVAALLPVSDVLAVDKSGQNALMHAVQGAKVANVAVLSRVCPVDATDRYGDTILAHALKAGPRTLQAVLALLPVDTRNAEGMTALMQAAVTPVKAADVLIPVLLKAGADPRLTDDLGRTALMHAVQVSPETVDRLLPLSDVGARDAQQRTVLGYAARGGTAETLASLLDVVPGAMLDLADEDGNTPLMNVCQYVNDPRCLTMLLVAGANPNRANGQGMTPLMALAAVVETGRAHTAAMVTVLLERGADPMLQDQDGRTVLDHLVIDEDHDSGWPVLRALIDRMPVDLVRAAVAGFDVPEDDPDRLDVLQLLVTREQQVLRGSIQPAHQARTERARPRL